MLRQRLIMRMEPPRRKFICSEDGVIGKEKRKPIKHNWDYTALRKKKEYLDNYYNI